MLKNQKYILKELKLEVTHDCDLKCVHCSSLSESETRRNMRVQDCMRLIREAHSLGVEKLAFSGGEPLLWEGIIEAVTLASELGIEVSLYTTGNVNDFANIATRLKHAGLSCIMFSIYSGDSSEHDQVTKVDGSLVNTLKAVEASKENGLDVEFHFVPLSTNFMNLERICILGKEYSADRVSVLRLVPQGRGYENSYHMLNNRQNVALRKRIIVLRKLGYDIRTGSPFNALLLKEKPKCMSGQDRLTISPELKIYPCDAFKQVTPQMLGIKDDFSDITNKTLKDCWENSSYLKLVREYLQTPFA